MARSFNGSVQIDAAFSAYAPPFTFACWAQSANTTGFSYPLTFCNFASADFGHALGFRGDVGGDPLEYYRASSGSSNAFQAGTYSANTWIHLTARSTAVNNIDLFVDGSATNGTVNISNAGSWDKVVIGAFAASSGYLGRLTGSVAEAALWNVALTDAQVVSLAKGFQPQRVQPASLRFYAPLVRGLAASLTDSGSTVADHPRTYGRAAL